MRHDDFPLKLQFEAIGHSHVICLDSSLQPDLIALKSYLTPALLDQAGDIRHLDRQREWILSRLLMEHVAGYIPRKGSFGELLWQGHHGGSLTHKRGHVALAFRDRCGSDWDPGVDLELARDLSFDLTTQIASEPEVLVGASIGSGWATALFSAKESIFKSLFRGVGQKFYYDAVELLDAVSVGDCGVMMFALTRDLGPYGAGSRLRVDIKKIMLGGEFFWLTSAKRGSL
jgi:4'-phosphopantetheinyl transferase EntD